ncbi:putative MEMBRANE PROTEIN [Paraburkholderia caribensis]|uniref:DUF1003 domain-containing protein n=1 Tax=Paraburkholderia caribensis TaxID=75105 RepID=UPI001CAD30DA|nr:DUF1003 domain-containing protein [Paraburkholderia caribensis]CAG9212499.1 putative MEMBRANE PROTEIN [Paraburkholderia caribensis]
MRETSRIRYSIPVFIPTIMESNIKSPTPHSAMAADHIEHDDPPRDHMRFQLPHAHLSTVFGNDWFALKAESFARFFGTPTFLLSQTLIVAIWIGFNVCGVTRFDVYPFVLLNLAFSLQSAYAAPLILLAQTRQADRDKAHADADARHREALAAAAERRDKALAHQTGQMQALLRQNTELTELTRDLTEQIARLTQDVHEKLTRDKHAKAT